MVLCGSAPCAVGSGPTRSQAELGAPLGRHWAPVKRQIRRKRHAALFISAQALDRGCIASQLHRRGHGTHPLR